MLVLSRRRNEKIVIGDDITITVLEVRGGAAPGGRTDAALDEQPAGLETIGGVFLGLASVGALVSVTVGTVKWIRGARDMKRIRPHLTNPTGRGPGIRFAGFSPVLDPTSGTVGGAIALRF